MMNRPLDASPILVLLSLAFGTPAVAVDYQRDIRPLLSDRCFTCHGPDEATREADLRLDQRSSATAETISGSIPIVAGKPEESELYLRITSDDESLRMPPADTGKGLTAAEIALIRQWIADGGEYREHWAFITPARPDEPTVDHSDWPRNSIDRFILARLEEEGLSPSVEAERATLLRRLSLDLIGLPPEPEEVASFVADSSPSAYRNAVERLLASPHYGEHWARTWLDGARYADSDGYEKDLPREVWMYRDWVVNAFNRDLPYDRFIIEQIAGDLLPHATQDQQVATGFLRNSMVNEEGGIDPEQFRMEAMFERMDILGKSVLGLTLNCVQCHTHKYDPVSHEEYYRVLAYLNNTLEASITVYPPEQQHRREAVLQQIRHHEEQLKRSDPQWRAKMALWEQAYAADRGHWRIVPVEHAGDNGQRFYSDDDGSVISRGYSPINYVGRFEGRPGAGRVSAVRLEALTDPELPRGGPGRSAEGLFAITEFELEYRTPTVNDGKAQQVKLISATADFGNVKQPLNPEFDKKRDKKRVTGPIDFAIDGNSETAWGIDAGPGRSNVSRQAVFVLEHPIDVQDETVVTFVIKQQHGGWNGNGRHNNNLGRFRLSITDNLHPRADPVPRRVRQILALAPAERTPRQTSELFSYWRTTVAAWADVNQQIEELWLQHPPAVSQLVLATRPEPRQTYVLERGDFLKPSTPVEPGVLSILHPLPDDAPPTRLALARWLVDRQAPTTARAIVNRVWQSFFGTGIVSTPEDYGLQGALPSHPELLDWLAVEFMENGWSLKHLHRLIVDSATYRQASRTTPELLEKDPANTLLARGPRVRVAGETVRDIALQASGLLTPKVGGPPVYPPAPEFLFTPPASYGDKYWEESQAPDRYRRALYTFRYRSVPYPMLTTFDTPTGESACVQRVRSNTPLQALTTLNETVFMECARALAQKTLHEVPRDDMARIKFAFRRCVARPPTELETAELARFLNKTREHLQASGSDPWQLAASDPTHPPPLPAGASPRELAAWTALSRVLLNLDETITKE